MYGQQQYGYGQGQGQGQGGFQGQNFQQQPQQGMSGNPSFLNSQPTGYPMQQQQQMQPMATGYPQQRPQSNLTGAPTGGGQGNFGFLNSAPPQFGNGNRPTGGLVSQMTGFPGGGASGLMPMQTGMMSQPTGMGMMPQPTGMGGGLRPQPTGVHDPRLQQMMQSFMPSNVSQPFNPAGAPQFNHQSAQPLTQQFQSLLDNPKVRTPKVPWTISKQEKKDYDQIFRAWDVQGNGFITGPAAIEVFGQSGLSQDDLMKIWNLSDGTNRGQLNVAEFHVAMGLIYRALNGNDIPDQLPEEMIPASMKDIDTTVNFMRDLLKHESSNRSNTSSPAYGADPRLSAAASKDASAYKHDDSGNAYKPSSRHLDRKSVRYAGEDPDAGINDIRRRLENTSAMLDKSAQEADSKSAEDEALEEEMDELNVQVTRLQDDLERVSKGRRSVDNDEKRRKYERELLFIMHEKLPELERRKKAREEDRRMEERAGVRARDKRNEGGRFRDDDKDWLRGSYDRERRDSRDRDYRRDDRDRERDRDDRGRDSRDRSRDREREYRPRSPLPSSSRAPPPAPDSTSAAAPPPAPPAPTKSAAVTAPSTKNMTPEERKEFIREQAQRRIADRLKALGVETPSADVPAVDNSVQERLEREKKEAEEKSQKAEKEQADRELARQKRLGGGDKESTPTPAAPASAPKTAMKKPAAPPPAPVSRKQPPVPPTSKSAVPAPSPAPIPAKVKAVEPEEEEDPEEAELRKRVEARQKAAADRKARMAALEKEEEEERAREEEMLNKRKARTEGRAVESIPTPTPVPAPAPAAEQTTGGGGGYNPFRKPSAAGVASPTPTSAPAPLTGGGGGGGFNPFFRPPATSTPPTTSTPPPSAPPAPPAPAPAPQPTQRSIPKSKPAEDEWEQIREKDETSDDDSSDDDYANSRLQRGKLASALFGNILPAAVTNILPASIRPDTSSPVESGASTPKPKSEALAKLGGGAPVAPGGGGGMSALLAGIQGGARLKKAQTVEKGVNVGGKVVGDAGAPAHISAVPVDRGVSPEPEPVDRSAGGFGGGDMEERTERQDKRQSVDWYAGLAADQAHPGQKYEGGGLEATREEEEVEPAAVDAVAVDGDGLDEFDMSKELRVRSLYNYDGQRDVDLSFAENVVITAHPAKDPESPWWYGTVVKSGEKGWFPHTYVEELHLSKAKALFSYEGTDTDQLPFLEGDILTIVDKSEEDWWKTEKAGVIFLVPASYLETIGDRGTDSSRSLLAAAAAAAKSPKVVDAMTNPWANTPPDITHSPPPPSTSEPISTPSPYSRQSRASPSPDPALLSPSPSAAPLPVPAITRLRSSTVSSATSVSPHTDSEDEDGGASSDDSMLSWWSSDGEEDSEDEEREAERRKREETRQKILDAAGLILKREPLGKSGPGSTSQSVPGPRKRRPAPAAPAGKERKSRRKAPGVPQRRPAASTEDLDREPEVEVKDAYAKYEQYLSQAKTGRKRANTTTSTTPRPVSVSLAVDVGAGTGAKEGGGGKITGFFSRMMAPSTSADSAPRKVISGPIIRRVDEGDVGSDGMVGVKDDAGIGKTWSSLVDPSVLETMSTRERKRQEAIFEFIATESTYNRDLQLIVNVYYASLLSAFPEMDEKALTVIFANIEDILLFNTGFLSSLEERQKSCRLYIDIIGDVLVGNAGGMGVYETYCVNQSGAERVLRSLRGGDEGLNRHLENIRENNPEVRGLDLSSFLLIPMQRITRYPLLLRQIAQYTEPDQDLSAVQSSLRTIEVVVGNINESVRETENEDRLRVLSEDLWVGGEGRIDLTAPTQYQGSRRLIKEGLVSKSKSGKKLNMVLCNDILILIESRNLYRMPIPLFELSVREGREGTANFAIKVDRHRGGDTVGLKAGNSREAKEWVGLIEGARRGVIERRKMIEPRMREAF